MEGRKIFPSLFWSLNPPPSSLTPPLLLPPYPSPLPPSSLPPPPSTGTSPSRPRSILCSRDSSLCLRISSSLSTDSGVQKAIHRHSRIRKMISSIWLRVFFLLLLLALINFYCKCCFVLFRLVNRRIIQTDWRRQIHFSTKTKRSIKTLLHNLCFVITL